MTLIRKALAGVAGPHEWPHDGAVLDVDRGLAAELLRIADGGFSEATDVPAAKPKRQRAPRSRPARKIAPERTPVTEPDPGATRDGAQLDIDE